jgi:hypothetical protein
VGVDPLAFNIRVSATTPPRPSRCAKAMVGDSPAHDTRFGSSNIAEMTGCSNVIAFRRHFVPSIAHIAAQASPHDRQALVRIEEYQSFEFPHEPWRGLVAGSPFHIG